MPHVSNVLCSQPTCTSSFDAAPLSLPWWLVNLFMVSIMLLICFRICSMVFWLVARIASIWFCVFCCCSSRCCCIIIVRSSCCCCWIFCCSCWCFPGFAAWSFSAFSTKTLSFFWRSSTFSPAICLRRICWIRPCMICGSGFSSLSCFLFSSCGWCWRCWWRWCCWWCWCWDGIGIAHDVVFVLARESSTKSWDSLFGGSHGKSLLPSMAYTGTVE